MLKPKDSVVIGVSGGPDSVALLHILLAFTPRWSLRLGIAHLNHSLRKMDSDRDARFVESLAHQFGLPCYIQKKNICDYQTKNRLSLEEAARSVRYKFLNTIAQTHGFDRIALGHHSGDNAELVLMNLFRGSGTRGLSGIPPVRDYKIIRPLIQVSRFELIDFLTQNNLKYVSDASNTDTRYLRNRVRHHLIPLLKRDYNPKISGTLNRLASIIRSEEEWLEDVVAPFFESAVLHVTKDQISLSIPMVNRYHPALQRRIIRMAIEKIKGNLRRIRFVNIVSAMGLLGNGPAFANIDLPDGIRIQKNRNTLNIFREKNALWDPRLKPDPSGTLTFEYKIERLDSVFIKEIEAHIRFTEMGVENIPDDRCAGQFTIFFDKDTLRFPMILRNFRPGDAFKPLGAGGTQKLKKYFIDKKVPRNERVRCPILLSGGKIIWVAGHRMDESVKVRPSTRNVLKVELLLA